MNNNPKTLLISASEIIQALDGEYESVINVIEKAFTKKHEGQVICPNKVNIIFDEESQNRINCMPGGIFGENIYGVKWVSVFPNNPKNGHKNVSGVIILSELEYGHTVAIMEAGVITNVRTAAIGAIVAKKFSRKNAETIGFIGAGQQARYHLDLIKWVCPDLRYCYVSSRSDSSTSSFVEEEKKKHEDMEFIDCGNDYESAVKDADIIVTAISGQDGLLKAKWIKKGALYIHVGGWEDEYAVARKANKIVCDDWESVKHRTQTISRMFKEGYISDRDIYGNLDEVICGDKAARESESEFVYFCSVGLAFVDVIVSEFVYDKCLKLGIGTPWQMC